MSAYPVVTRTGVRVPDAAGLAGLRQRFDAEHALVLHGLLDAELLAAVARALATADFTPRHYEGIGSDTALDDDHLAAHMLAFALNRRELFAAIEQITGCGGIGWHKGRVYRISPGPHSLDWHDDRDEAGRLVALSVNLGSEPYAGGRFEMRRRDDQRIFSSIANTGAGDGLLFRIGSGFEHRVTPVEGSVPKTAFAGWFMSAQSGSGAGGAGLVKRSS